MRNISVVLLTLSYPLLVYWVIDRVEPRYLAVILMLILLLRRGSLNSNSTVSGGTAMLLAGAALFLAVFLANSSRLLLVYPVMVNAVFFLVFAYSLVNPPTIAERLARLQEPHLPRGAVDYTRKVTLAWCGFFLANGLVSTATAWSGDLDLWGLYNGLIAYLLMGILMAAELWIRKRVKKGFQDVH